MDVKCPSCWKTEAFRIEYVFYEGGSALSPVWVCEVDGCGALGYGSAQLNDDFKWVRGDGRGKF